MTGSGALPNWQDKELRILEGLIHRDDFKADIAALPDGDFETRFTALMRIADKYGLHGAVMVLDNYARTGEIVPDDVIPRMSVICDADETAGPTDSIEHARYNYVAERGFPKAGVYIFIPPGTTQIAAKSFLQSSWSYIESKLGGRQKRVRRMNKAERDAEVLRLHELGLKDREVADKINADDRVKDPITYLDVGRIVKRKS